MQQATAISTAQAASPPMTDRERYDAGFAEAYETYYTRVFAFVYSRVRDVEVSRDIVSTVFEKAYVKGHEVRNPAAYGSWLYMVAKNAISGHFRSTKRQANSMDRIGDELRVGGPHPDPSDYAIRNESISSLMEYVRTLRERDQELISLKFDSELTNAEIAQVTGVTPLNVRVAIFRALKRLRARMQDDVAGLKAA
jgi:RNA polymerase sigma factor (sigma-70 family)